MVKAILCLKKSERGRERRRNFCIPGKHEAQQENSCIHSPEHFSSAWLGMIKRNLQLLTFSLGGNGVERISSVLFVVLPRDWFLSYLSLSTERNGMSGHREQRQSRWLGLAPESAQIDTRWNSSTATFYSTREAEVLQTDTRRRS